MNNGVILREWIDLIEANEDLKLERLPFAEDALSPVMSKETIDIHYNTLTKNYYKKAKETGDSFQVAGAFLHGLFWENLRAPKSDNKPTGKCLEFLNEKFGSFAIFKTECEERATTIQGNGWCALTKSGKCVQILNHKKRSDIILLIDMWEHAYFIDYGADKKKYMKNFWKIVNWDVVEGRL